MLDRDGAGLLARALIFVPIRPDKPGLAGIGMRWVIHTTLNHYVAWTVIKRVVASRGSPRSTWFVNLSLIFVCAILSATSYAEIKGTHTTIKEYNDLLLLIIEILFALYYCARQGLHLFSSAPGPALAKFTSLWKVYHLIQGSYEQTVLELHRRYGDVIRVGPYEYSISTYGAYRSVARKLRPLPIEELNERVCGIVALFFFCEDPPPAILQTMMQRGFKHESEIDACNAALVESLLQYSACDEPIRLERLISCYAWDIMGSITTGQSFGFMDMEEDTVFMIDRIESWKFYTVLTGTFFRFHPWITALLGRSGWRQRANAKLALTLFRIVNQKLRISATLDEEQSKNSAAYAARKSILDAYASEAIEEKSDALLSTFLALSLAASDSVARHILSTLFHLGRNADVAQRLRDELELLPFPLSCPPRLQELIYREADLPYLNAVLSESYRMRDCDSSRFTFMSPSKGTDTWIGNHHIPREATVRLSEHASMRDRNVFGGDADLFSPERWLGGNAPTTSAYSIGSTDPRVSRALVAKIIIQIVQVFDIYLPTPTTSSATDTVHARFTIAPSLKRQLSDAGIHRKSPMADHVTHLRRHFGHRCVTAVLEACASRDAEAVEKYSTLVGLKSKPIYDNNKRRLLHQAVRALSDGVLESKTSKEDQSVEIGPKGFGEFHFRAGQQHPCRGRGRGNGRWGPRGRPIHRDDESIGNHAANGNGEDTRSFRSRRNGDPAVIHDPRTAGWNAFGINAGERDLAENNVAHQRVDTMVKERKIAGFKAVQTFKQTSIVNGARTTVAIMKDGEVVGGGIALQKDEPEEKKVKVEALRGFIPPHKRHKVTAQNEGVHANAESQLRTNAPGTKGKSDD